MMIRRFHWLLVCMLFLCLGYGCSDDTTEPIEPSDTHGADSIAAYWMQALGDSLENLPEGEDAEVYEEIRYTAIRNGMNEAFALDPNSRVAHLGCALLEMIEINYSPKLWEMIDSLDAYAEEDNILAPLGGLYFRPGSPILGNQFTLLATAPRELARRSFHSIPGNLTLGHVQEVMDEVVIPAIGNAIGHLAEAERDGGPEIDLRVDDEHVEIDQGEILFFDAALHAARAGLRIATAYEVDLLDRQGTYDWIDEIRDMDLCDSYGFVEPYDEHYVKIVDVQGDWTSTARESIAVSILEYNLEEREDFLSRRDNRMADAYQDLLTVRDKLQAAITAIRGETGDNQEDDVIKIADIVDLDEEIAEGEDKPRFATDFMTIDDVLDWIEQIITGPYDISEEGENGDIELRVDLSALFLSAPSNWKEFLPFYRFKPPEEWFDRVFNTWGHDTRPGREYCYWTCDGERHCRDDVAYMDYHFYESDLDPIELLDGPDGAPIDLETEKIPYFADYTLGGLFPDADRNMWLDIAEAAGW